MDSVHEGPPRKSMCSSKHDVRVVVCSLPAADPLEGPSGRVWSVASPVAHTPVPRGWQHRATEELGAVSPHGQGLSALAWSGTHASPQPGLPPGRADSPAAAPVTGGAIEVSQGALASWGAGQRPELPTFPSRKCTVAVAEPRG